MFFFVVVESRFGVFQAVILSLLIIFSAQYILLTYGSTITEKTGTNISPKVSSICMAVIQLFATVVTIILIDRKGRRFLLTLSMLGCALSHGLIATFLCLLSNGFDTTMYHWVPIFGMSSAIFFSSIGIIPLFVICVAESFPTKSRSFGMALSTTLMNVLLFIAAKFYPIVEHFIGLQTCLWIFCAVCTLGVFYSAFIVNETKGKELNITNELESKEPNA